MLIIIPKGIIVIIQIRYLFFDTLVTIQNRHYCLLARIRIVENFSILQESIYICVCVCVLFCFVLRKNNTLRQFPRKHQLEGRKRKREALGVAL
jgi:hypothetical protein